MINAGSANGIAVISDKCNASSVLSDAVDTSVLIYLTHF
jgi:hypothetical protein